MYDVIHDAFLNELSKIGMAMKIKSNDRMPPRTKANIEQLVGQVHSWDSPHRDEAVKFMEEATPAGLFDMLHGMRRWYSGQTMARKLLDKRDSLSSVMKLDPKDAVGSFRGFKVPKDSSLATSVEVGQQLTLPVTRNHGFSSWTTSQDAANKFSGAGKGKIGLVVKLVDAHGITPVLAPPSHTEPWFNELYSKVIGSSFRPKEGEYLVAAPSVKVEVVRVKR